MRNGALRELDGRLGGLDSRQGGRRGRAARSAGDSGRGCVRAGPGPVRRNRGAAGCRSARSPRRPAAACDRAETDAGNRDRARWPTKRSDRLSRLSNKIVAAMGEFRRQYPVETTELDDSVDAADGYRELHGRLTGDDLPRFRRQFKTYLNQNTIRDIAGFQSQLNKQAELIRERIATINSSLVGVDYNPGRYIRLEPLPSPHADIRDFRADLRACTDDAVSGEDSDHYSEQKFLQVSRIIERFRGREGLTEADRRWTRFVTDVRNWYTFAASERYPRGRHRVRALRRLRRQVRRAEGEARLHDPGRLARLPVQAGVGRGEVTDVPVRGHRRGVRPGLGRVDPVRAGAVRPARPAAADRHPAAEDPRHRAVRRGGGLRGQPAGQQLAAADADHRGVPGPRRSRCPASSPSRSRVSDLIPAGRN